MQLLLSQTFLAFLPPGAGYQMERSNGNPCKSLEDERKPLEMVSTTREKRNEDKYLPSRKGTGEGKKILNGWLARDTDLELEGGTTCLLRCEGESLRKAGRVSPNTVDLGV